MNHRSWVASLALLALACSQGPKASGSGGADAAADQVAAAGDATATDGTATDAPPADVIADAPPAPFPGELVQGSEKDATLTGTDADGNGVRDDVDGLVGAIEPDAARRAMLTAFARESTKLMLVGGAADDARAQQERVVKTVDCLATVYEPPRRRELVTALLSALYNNAARQMAYRHADALLSGSILPRPSKTCDAALIGA